MGIFKLFFFSKKVQLRFKIKKKKKLDFIYLNIKKERFLAELSIKCDKIRFLAICLHNIHIKK